MSIGLIFSHQVEGEGKSGSVPLTACCVSSHRNSKSSQEVVNFVRCRLMERKGSEITQKDLVMICEAVSLFVIFTHTHTHTHSLSLSLTHTHTHVLFPLAL